MSNIHEVTTWLRFPPYIGQIFTKRIQEYNGFGMFLAEVKVISCELAKCPIGGASCKWYEVKVVVLKRKGMR